MIVSFAWQFVGTLANIRHAVVDAVPFTPDQATHDFMDAMRPQVLAHIDANTGDGNWELRVYASFGQNYDENNNPVGDPTKSFSILFEQRGFQIV